MLRLLGLAISIGLADSLNPSTIGPALLLASGERPLRGVLLFALGVGGVFLLGGLILVFGPGSAILALVPKPGPTARYVLETVAGVAMLIAAGVIWRRRHRGGGEEKSTAERRAERSPLLVGGGLSLVELPTAFPYFAVIAAIVGSGFDPARKAIVIVVYSVCFVLPLLVIAAVVAILGGRAVDALASAREWLRRRWRRIVVVIGVLAGVFVTTLGVSGLTGRAGGPVGRVSRGVHQDLSHPGP